MIHAWPLWNARLEPGRRALMQAGDSSGAVVSGAPPPGAAVATRRSASVEKSGRRRIGRSIGTPAQPFPAAAAFGTSRRAAFLRKCRRVMSIK